MLLSSCDGRQGRLITQAISLADDDPDSAIAVLQTVNQRSLSDKEKARYALTYTMAQDKSGLDVDNDSLIGIAYGWYKDLCFCH